MNLTPMVLGLGPWELAIVLLIVVLLFGGSKLAGVGKASGRAIREFREETRDLRDQDRQKQVNNTQQPIYPPVINQGEVNGQEYRENQQ